MIDLDLLQELVIFRKYGTISATARYLKISQPTVTRGMRKLEQDLGIKLFNRDVINHISLNDTGLHAAQEAEKVLRAEQDFTENVLNYDRFKHQMPIASVAPGPLIFILANRKQLSAQLIIQPKIIKLSKVVDELKNLKERIIISNYEIETKELESVYLGTEYVSLGLQKKHPLSNRDQLSFKDLSNIPILAVKDMGPWKEVIENNVENYCLLYQDNFDSLIKVANSGCFNFLYSNLTEQTEYTFDRIDRNDHKRMPIHDSHNKVIFYGTYLKQDRDKVLPVIKKISAIWPD